MKWSAIITTYNSAKVIGRALDSLFALPSDEKPSSVVVVDNASTDSTLAVVNATGFSVKTIVNTVNLGLSKANNLGAALVEEGSLFFLNPDVAVKPGAVTALREFEKDHPDAALIGPAMVDEEGNRQSTARTWPGPLVIASRRTPLAKTLWGRKISSDHMNRFNTRRCPTGTEWLVGAAMWLTPRGRQQVGLMSEKYFLYFEDVEWCWRAWQAEMEVWFEPNAEIIHVCKRESTSGGKTLHYHLRSMVRFILSHPNVIFNNGPGGKKLKK